MRRRATSGGRAALILAGVVWSLNVAQAQSATATQTLSANTLALGKLAVPGSVTLLAAGTHFSPYTGSLAVTYRIRTSPAGSGTITLQGGTDFTAGGPSIAAGNLTYTCGAPTLGTGCSGTQTVRVGQATPVASIPASACTGGGGACSAADPNTVQVNLSLGNDPGYRTGSYSASLVFNISSL